MELLLMQGLLCSCWRPPRYIESREQVLADVRQLCPECHQLTTRHLCNPLCREFKSYFCPGSGTCDGFCGSYPCCGCCDETKTNIIETSAAYHPPLGHNEQQKNQVHFPDLLFVMRQLIDFMFSEKKPALDFERGVYQSVITAMGGPEAFANLVHHTVDPDVRALKGQVVSVGVLHAIRLKQISNPTTWEYPHGGYLDFVTQVNLPTYLRIYGRSLSPYSRHKVVQLLSNSPDPEIRDWALHRNSQSHQLRRTPKSEELPVRSLMDHKSYRSALLHAISASLSLEEAQLVQDDEHIWGPLELQLDDFGIGAMMAGPVGSPEASVGIVFESTLLHDYNESGQVTSIPWGLRECGFQASNSLIWPFNLQRYVYLPECFQVQSPSTSKRDILRNASQELIAGAYLRIIIMCGDIEDIILPANTKEVILSLDHMTYNTWVEIQQMKIARIFIRAPTPLSELWASHGRQAYELTGIFKLCSMALALIVRRWANERDGKIPPASPADLEPVLRVWLADKGFKEDESLLCLADAVGGSLRYGLLVLTLSLPKPRRKAPRPRRIPRSNTERRHVIPKAVLDRVRSIHNELYPHDEGFLIQTMDSLELIDDAEDQYVPTTGEQLNEVLSEKDSPTSSISFRSGLKLDCRVNRASFTIQHCTVSFDIEHQPTDENFFWVKAELFPIGERHPQAWATAAQEYDPGARLAFRIYRQDDNGFEIWWTYASNDSWETSCQANSLVDKFEGSSFVELCTKPRRYIYIDDRYIRLKREYPELIPFVGGAYTTDNMDVIPAKSSRRGGKYSKPRGRRLEDPYPRANKQAKRSDVEELESILTV
ncbi:hypothetical protein BJX62DRAFT_222521 [Aspergillus germanicus]